MSSSSVLSIAGRSKWANDQLEFKGRGKDHLPNATDKYDEGLEMPVAFSNKQKVADLDKSTRNRALSANT